MNVTIVGTGYVGITTGVALAFFGHKVTCVDKNPKIVETLSKGVPTIHEPGLGQLLELAMPNLTFTTNIPKLSGENIVIIAVGTPTKEGGDADLKYLDAATGEIADQIQPGARLVVVNKSTVPVGTARHVDGILQRGLRENNVEATVYTASNPEFLAEGQAVKDTLYPDRIVVGTDDEDAKGMLRELYTPLIEQTFDAPSETPRPENLAAPVFIATTATSSEVIKYAANSFLATKISFINEFAGLAEHVGADITEVARAIGLDDRIGKRFLNAGIGWGGSCFGKDTRAIVTTASRYGYEMPIVASAIEVNTRQRKHVVERLQQELKVLRGTTIGLLGLAFKGNTDDLRDAPALTLIEELSERGATIKVHDPITMDNAKAQYPNLNVEYCEDVTSLANGCDAVVVVTDWDEYRQLPLDDMKKQMRGNLIMDARNLLEPETVEAKGFDYIGIGR